MMIEEGEFADWKVIAIDAADDDAELLNGIEDVEGKWPGLLDYLRTWWRFYHKGANKDDRAKKNKFGFHENFFGRDFTIANVVDRGNQAWFEQYSPERKKHKFISHVNISDVETDVEVTLTDEYDESRYSDMELDDGIVGMRGDQIVDIVDADKIRSRDRQSYASTNLDAASQGITVGKLDIGGLVNQTHKVQAFLDGVDDDRVREAFNSSAYQQYKQNVFSGGLRPAVHDQNDIDEFLARV